MHPVILNTRPALQSENLTRLLSDAGMQVYHLPVLAIQPTLFSSPNFTEIDYVIFLSANAVTHFFSHTSSSELNSTRIIAIGSATQTALLHHGLKNILLPNIFNSEGILAMPCLQNISQKNICIISGENPKPLLTQMLLKRGATIKNIYCYKRICNQDISPDELKNLLNKNIDFIISTSVNSLQCLINLFERSHQLPWLCNKCFCLINQDMKTYALKHGISKIIIAENATDAAICDAIKTSIRGEV